MESKRKVTAKGTIIWSYINDHIIHREDGPAVIFPDGREYWYLDGYCYELEEMPLNLFLACCKWEYKKNGK